jgi:hypothetical protein
MSQFDAVIADIQRRIEAADRRPLAALQTQLRNTLPAPLLDQSMAALTYYIESCPVMLRDFAIAAGASYSESLQQVAASLYQYLIEPHDLLDDSNGILGFLDDAWLIHNMAYRCVQSQLVAAGRFSADWNAIVLADRFVVHLFPPHVKATLEDIAGQYSSLVAREMQLFQAPTGWGEFQNGSGSSGGKTIDDYYFTIGGASYLSTKPVS